MVSLHARLMGLITALLLSSTELSAEIYKTVDEHGNVTYTDRKPDDGNAVELRTPNRVPAVQTPAPATQADQPAADKPVRYSRLKITSPADDSAIEHGPGDFTVTTSSRPRLASGHKMQLMLNGKAYGEPGTSGNFSLENVDRGTHTLQVRILNKAGKVMKKSSTIEVHVFRPSVLSPGYRG